MLTRVVPRPLLPTRQRTRATSPLSLHDALPILGTAGAATLTRNGRVATRAWRRAYLDRGTGRTWVAAFRDGIAEHERRSEEHTSELQSQSNVVCRLLLEKKKSRSGAPRACTSAR